MSQMTMYSTSWCPDCRNAKRFLREHGIAYDEIDIVWDEAAARRVIGWSGGRRVIPTLHIVRKERSEPIVLHNPPLRKLAELLGIEY